MWRVAVGWIALLSLMFGGRANAEPGNCYEFATIIQGGAYLRERGVSREDVENMAKGTDAARGFAIISGWEVGKAMTPAEAYEYALEVCQAKATERES